MGTRRRMRGTAFRAGAAVGAVLLLAGACSGGDDGPGKTPGSSGAARPPVSQGGGVIQSRFLSVGTGVRVDLLALDRVSPKVVVGRWRVVSTLDAPYAMEGALDPTWPKSPPEAGAQVDENSVGGISLLDGKNAQRHYPLNGTDDRCLCSRDNPTAPTVPAKGTLDLVAAFPAPPADVPRLDVMFPTAPPFLDIPVTDRPDQKMINVGGAEIDVTTAPTAPPRVLKVVAAADDATGSEDDGGGDLSVRLSTDVLFAVNKADLTPKAQDALRKVAQKIDQSTGTTVKIEGHADNTGTDAINNPLSQRRAESVKAALERLVTRSGVTYQTSGHGSTQPIASNDNEEGRRVNRRVTVTFTRPRPPAAAPPASAAPSTPAGGGWPVLATAPAGPGPFVVSSVWPKKAEVRINELRRDSNGYVSLVWTLRNDDDKPLPAERAMTDWSGLYLEYSTSAAALSADGRRYRVARDGHKVALGPNLTITPVRDFTVDKGEEYTLWAMFKVPADVQAVTVEIPGFRAIQNLPVR
ncbi:hypothetical protein DPM19_15805 [Actinomadura craniellae]|uniref:OmpA-like domain-containing protein n=1 Tax=Actinomadura craniellae TaxID=2231787 RepID=A0A365H5Q2_9ACTN|nr:OmpA family protein [Actinomadura craniellae]RAY14421.1 hypothetical protein DPM19_15805 [Actinomadura craniellae]